MDRLKTSSDTANTETAETEITKTETAKTLKQKQKHQKQKKTETADTEIAETETATDTPETPEIEETEKAKTEKVNRDYPFALGLPEILLAQDRDDIDNRELPHDEFNDRTIASLFEVPYMLNIDQTMIYRKQVEDPTTIDSDKMIHYMIRVYRYIFQRLIIERQQQTKDQLTIPFLSPKEFATVCCTLAQVRIHLLNAKFYQTEYPFSLDLLPLFPVPDLVAKPIIRIGVVSAGPTLAMIIPKEEMSENKVNCRLRKLSADGSLRKFREFVAVAKQYKITNTQVLDMHVGGSYWWLMLGRAGGSPDYYNCWYLESFYSYIPEEDVKLADIVNRKNSKVGLLRILPHCLYA